MRSPGSRGSASFQPLFPPLGPLGTVNPEALASPVLRHRPVYAEFDAVARLSATLAKLKTEYHILSGQLTDIISGPDQTRFTRFKQAEIDFGARLIRRESEMGALGKFMNRYRANTRPTFVEVDASSVLKSAKHSYDLINASLLVSNEQRPFFAQPDLERQNTELRSLIDEQQEALRLLGARLKLFSSFQKAKSAEFTLNSLQRGRPPAPAAADTPTMATELRTKLRVLSADLGQLVAERRALTTHRITRKIKARIRRQSREVEAGTWPRDYDEDYAAAPPTEAGLHVTDAEENHPLPDTVAD